MKPVNRIQEEVQISKYNQGLKKKDKSASDINPQNQGH